MKLLLVRFQSREISMSSSTDTISTITTTTTETMPTTLSAAAPTATAIETTPEVLFTTPKFVITENDYRLLEKSTRSRKDAHYWGKSLSIDQLKKLQLGYTEEDLSKFLSVVHACNT